MGCSGCNAGGLPKGCRGNGQCGTGGCEKLEVFDWLSNMDLPAGQKKFDWVEVRFKNGRKDFYKNTNELPLKMGDVVAVESSPGHDIGIVTLTGELVKVQMKKKKSSPQAENFRKVYRQASQKDIDRWKTCQEKEIETMYRSRELALRLGLQMKISDVEYQGDGAKATFYYTADERVDFRQLIKDMASQFSIRIEMRQIGARQEAGRLGGIGSCGRELCCSTWLTDFRSVNTSAARYQQLSLNPAKLAGQCGKLKCCLNYELDSYLESIKKFPSAETKLRTKKGLAVFQKMDIFKELIWYAYDDQPMTWVPIKASSAQRIKEMNQNKEFPESLEEFGYEVVVEAVPVYENVVGQDDIKRFDQPKSKKRNNKKRNFKPRRRNNRGQNNQKG